MTNKNKKFIRILALFLAALMVLGLMTYIFAYIFA